MAAEEKWYFDPATDRVEKGKVSGWNKRMGPYDSRAEAENALRTARQRTAQADARAAEEAAEDDWGEPASWER